MDKLIEEIDYRCNLSDTEMTLLRQTLRILHFPKGSIVIGEGKTDDSIYFLDKGVWRKRDTGYAVLWNCTGNVLFERNRKLLYSR